MKITRLSKKNYNDGFTIVELLIVIGIIGILAAITVVAFNGVQQRAKSSKAQADISNVNKLVQAYKATNGEYPITAPALFAGYNTSTARTDINCGGGSKQSDWVPGISSSLPQSGTGSIGAQNADSCYIYASDGTDYVLSAWNGGSTPQSTTMYRRIGFRESYQTQQYYLCNFGAIGGSDGGYNKKNDYYRHSFTFSNITSCNESEPAGA